MALLVVEEATAVLAEWPVMAVVVAMAAQAELAALPS